MTDLSVGLTAHEVLILTPGLVIIGHAILAPMLMVLMMATGDAFAM